MMTKILDNVLIILINIHCPMKLVWVMLFWGFEVTLIFFLFLFAKTHFIKLSDGGCFFLRDNRHRHCYSAE